MLLACGVWGTECCWSSRAHNRECPDLRGVRVETACFVITELISCWLIEFVFEGIMRRNSKMSWARLFFWATWSAHLAIHTEAIAGLLTMRMGSLNLICSQFKQTWCTICKEALALKMVVIQPWEGLQMLRRLGTASHWIFSTQNKRCYSFRYECDIISIIIFLGLYQLRNQSLVCYFLSFLLYQCIMCSFLYIKYIWNHFEELVLVTISEI